jgi:hypothetical protein
MNPLRAELGAATLPETANNRHWSVSGIEPTAASARNFDLPRSGR